MRNLSIGILAISCAGWGCTDRNCAETSTCAAPQKTTADAAVEDSGNSPRCDPSAPFVSAGVFGEFKSTFSFSLTSDERTAFFVASTYAEPLPRGNFGGTYYSQIHFAVRAETEGRFGKPIRPPIFDDGITLDPSISSDERSLFFIRQIGTDSVTQKIWRAKWDGNTASDPEEMRELNGANIQRFPCVNTAAIYFSRPMDPPTLGSNTPHRLFRAGRLGDSVTAPTELKTEGGDPAISESAGVVTADDRVLYFQRNLTSTSSKSKPIIFRAQRPEPGQPFGKFEVVKELEKSLQLVTWVSADDCVIYGNFDGDIRRFVRPPQQ